MHNTIWAVNLVHQVITAPAEQIIEYLPHDLLVVFLLVFVLVFISIFIFVLVFILVFVFVLIIGFGTRLGRRWLSRIPGCKRQSTAHNHHQADCIDSLHWLLLNILENIRRKWVILLLIRRIHTRASSLLERR